MVGKPQNGRKRPLTVAQRKRNQRARNKAQAIAMRRSERLVEMQAKAEAQSAAVAASNAAFAASPYEHKRFACGMVDVPLDFKECMQIIEAWGFRKAKSLYWVKTRPDGTSGYMSTGYYAMADPVEELWICRRGGYVGPMMGDGFELIAWLLPATEEHSEKPQEFYAAIERLHPGVELLDMFARVRRPRWWAYGDQIEGLIQPPLP